jgi:flagellar assembly factor FliW
MEATANLSAPVVINADSRIGKQIVLEDEAYTVRYPIFEQRAMATAA